MLRSMGSSTATTMTLAVSEAHMGGDNVGTQAGVETMKNFPTEVQPAVPLKYERINGDYITIMPMTRESMEPIFHLTHETVDAQAVWRYLPYGPFTSFDEMCAQFLSQSTATTDKFVFCILDKKTGAPIGMACLIDCNHKMGSAEIATVVYPPKYQRTEANTEVTYLLMNHCFKSGFRRVVWKCDNNNAKSKQAAIRLGFELEGIFHNHMIVKGQNRDTAWFGMIDRKWPAVAANYRRWLGETDPGKRQSLLEMNSRVPTFSEIMCKPTPQHKKCTPNI